MFFVIHILTIYRNENQFETRLHRSFLKTRYHEFDTQAHLTPLPQLRYRHRKGLR